MGHAQSQVRQSPTKTTPEVTGDGGQQSRQSRLGNARIVELMKQSGGEALDDLVDLTPSQAAWIRRLRDLEMLNPNATVADLSMAVSLKVWSAGQMWDQNGKSQYPGLILDYKGGDGYKSVRFDDGQKGGKRVDENGLKDWAQDASGASTNVNHAFPAIAAQAGRSRLAGEYASFMATSGGDTLQNLGETVVNGNTNQWSAGEYKGNLRGETMADENREKGGKLSDNLLRQFRTENQAAKKR